MNIIKYIIGFCVEKLHNTRIYYRGIHNTNIVNNNGGIVSGNVDLGCPYNIYIGPNSYVNGGSLSASPNALIRIGRDCLISYNVHIRTDTHIHSNCMHPINQQGIEEHDITIEDNCWIGYGAQIMAGVTIARDCIIGAGAVVTHDTLPGGVYVGAPAHRIKDRE